MLRPRPAAEPPHEWNPAPSTVLSARPLPTIKPPIRAVGKARLYLS